MLKKLIKIFKKKKSKSKPNESEKVKKSRRVYDPDLMEYLKQEGYNKKEMEVKTEKTKKSKKNLSEIDDFSGVSILYGESKKQKKL